jgi:hypothetical protein
VNIFDIGLGLITLEVFEEALYQVEEVPIFSSLLNFYQE